MRQATVRATAALVAMVVLGAAWYVLAPTELGGRTSYAVTFGSSMEPHFHRGDLVVLRKRSSYSVGEVVAYRSDELGKNVLHRIIAVRGGRYTFKGDNNDFVDPEHPTRSALVGVEWLRIPRIGTVVGALHKPLNAAIAAGLTVLLLVLSGGSTAAHRRRRRGQSGRRLPAPPAGAATSLGLGLAALGAGAVVAAAALGAAAFAKAPHRTVRWSGLYVQHGAFGYAAPVPRGAAYQRTEVTSGEPVYVRLVQRLPVFFRYHLESTEPGLVSGSVGLDAVLHDDQGWRYAIPLAPGRRFVGRSAVVRGVLDLSRLQNVVAAFERESGEHNSVYHVSLDAHVRARGTLGADALTAAFAPRLALDLDQLRLVVAGGSGLRRSKAETGTRTVTNALHAFGRAVTVVHARRMAMLLGLVGLTLTGVGGLVMLLDAREQEAAAIRRRYAGWIVEVVPIDHRGATERRVASMDALARLARQYDRLILHERRGDGDAFLVEDDGVVYTYAVVAR